jgi:hypothetical protein
MVRPPLDTATAETYRALAEVLAEHHAAEH